VLADPPKPCLFCRYGGITGRFRSVHRDEQQDDRNSEIDLVMQAHRPRAHSVLREVLIDGGW